MKTKTINKILCNKLDKWLESITDESVRDLAKKNTIITGGCIVSMLQQENVNDYDLYFRNFETSFAITKYYCDRYKAAHPNITLTATHAEGRINIQVNSSKNHSIAGDSDAASLDEIAAAFNDADDLPASVAGDEGEPDKAKRYQPVFLSNNAITLTTKIQLIIRFYGEPDEIHKNFDFVHVTNYFDSATRVVTYKPEALTAIMSKELRYMGSLYPICSLIRTRKFISRGWTINAGQYVKMAFQISKLNLEDIKVLRDQLIGVDSLFFANFIAEMKKHTDEGGVVTQDYVTTLLDKIF